MVLTNCSGFVAPFLCPGMQSVMGDENYRLIVIVEYQFVKKRKN